MTPLTPNPTVQLQDLQHIRGIRNNNPLNLRLCKRNAWLGQVGSDEDGFCRFSSPVFGFRAAFITLQTYRRKHGCHALQDYIHRWAPPSENPTEAYIQALGRWTGIQPHQAPQEAQWLPLVMAMTAMECGTQAATCPALWQAAERAWQLFQKHNPKHLNS